MSCTTTNGISCPTPSTQSTCGVWNINNDNVNCYSNALIQESINIAGAPINIFKLLGVHEQSRLVDVLGEGEAFSNGDAKGFSSENAFNAFRTEWRSKQTGTAIITNAMIGYDFGVKKIFNGRVQYGIDANIRKHITTIKIKQSSDERMRASKIRVERSDDKQNWYGVAILTLENNSDLNTIHFKHSVPSRYWRFRPLEMFSGDSCIRWGIQALELSEYDKTNLNNIQDKILLENRNRDYGDAILLKGYYELLSVATELTRFGLEIPNATYQIKIHFETCVKMINRPIVIGDIIELPSETQYTSTMEPVKRYLEVTDVTWDSTSYTPGWKPTMLLITAQPALATEETQDIFGSLVEERDSSGLFDNGKTSFNWQDLRDVDQTIRNQSNTEVSERGSEGSNTIREFSEEEIQIARDMSVGNLANMNLNPNAIYIEDAIPPNGLPFTEGDSYPENPSDGDYHRLTYSGLASDVPAKLYQYSIKKQRWIYKETDKRYKYNDQKAFLKEFL